MKINLTETQKEITDWALDPMDDYLNHELRDDDPDDWNGPYTLPTRDGAVLDFTGCHRDVISDFLERVDQLIDMGGEQGAHLPGSERWDSEYWAARGVMKSARNLMEKIKTSPVLDPNSPDFVIAQFTELERA